MNFAEILFLFALDGGRGTIKPEMERGLDCALAGALLMDLALHNRVDTDLTCIRTDPEQASRDPLLLRVVDKTPTGDGLLDGALEEIRHKSDPRPTRDWLIRFSAGGGALRARVAGALAAAGILEIREERKMFFFKTSRFRILDSGGMDAVRARLKELVLGDEIPDPREAALAGIADFCRIFDSLFSTEEMAHVRPRIDAIRKLDLIGQAMAVLIRDVEQGALSCKP